MKPEQFQLLAMAIGPVATLIVVFLGVLFQNRRVDVRISDLQRSMEVRFADLTRSTDARFSSVDGKFIDITEMRAHQSELLAKFAELDTRLTRIENERRIVQ